MDIIIPGSTLLGFAAAGIWALLLPFAVRLIVRRRTFARTAPLIAGILAYMFISLLRGIARVLLLNGSAQENRTLFFFLSALISGVFEEVGRYLVFRFVLPNHDRSEDALAYGVGHGGLEELMVYAIDGISLRSLYLGLIYQSEGLAPFLADGCDREETLQTMAQIAAFTFGDSMLTILDCLCCMAFHIALSVIVFSAAHDAKDKKLLWLAVGIHTLCNFFGMMIGGDVSLAGTAYNLLHTAIVCYLAYRIHTYYRAPS